MAEMKYRLEGGTGPNKQQSAEQAYDTLMRDRHSVVDTARDMAELTIPSVFPPEGYKPGDTLPGNNQSYGAYCVNNLASNLMFLAFPPSRPMMRFEVLEHKLRDEIEQDPELWSKIELALSRREQEHRKRAMTTGIRSAYTGALKLLLIAGNCCWKHIELNAPCFYRPDSYVVQRDSRGNQLLVILKESISVASLDPDIKELVMQRKEELKNKPEWERQVDIYSVCKLHVDDETGEKTWCYWQEFDGELLADTEVETDEDNPTLYAAWLIPVYGANWGRSYCEEYRGDLYTVENQASALNDGAAAASMVITFVKPGARTSAKAIRMAQNLSVLPGTAEDVTSYQLNKSQDFQFVSNTFEAAARRLGRAFAVHASIQRDAERVTAEEWQTLAAELEKAMGGLYSELAWTFQRAVVVRFILLHEDEDADLVPLPSDIIMIGVLTGIDSLGRSQEAIALDRFAMRLQRLFGPEITAKALAVPDYARRAASSEGINPEGLVKSEEMIQQEAAEEQQRAQQMALLEKGTGPVAGAVAKATAESAAAQYQQQQQSQQQEE